MPSESEATRRWLGDIHHHIVLAKGFIAGLTYDAFKDDRLRLYAVTRCLEIISEASRRLPDELKMRHPSIERRWQTLTVSLPLLHDVIRQELETLDPRRFSGET
jgi:uncharacterized protein with HEPN domain